MKTAKLFVNGSSQAVRLPKAFRFSGREVYANKIGDVVMLFPARKPWSALGRSLAMFTEDFMAERHQPVQPRRDML